MADACCGPDDDRNDGGTEAEPQRFTDIREVRAAALAGLVLGVGFAASAADAYGAAVVLVVAALVVGGSTFVPETMRALLRGRVGVGTLTTIAAIGAIALGEYGEAASLAFLFSISEALEGYALARTRRGLRALLALVPERVKVRSGGGAGGLAPEDLEVGAVMVVGHGARLATEVITRTGRPQPEPAAHTSEYR